MKVQHEANQPEPPPRGTSYAEQELSDGFTETVRKQKEFEKFQIINWLKQEKEDTNKHNNSVVVATLSLQAVPLTASSSAWLEDRQLVTRSHVVQFTLGTEGFDSWPGSNTSTARGLSQAAEVLSAGAREGSPCQRIFIRRPHTRALEASSCCWHHQPEQAHAGDCTTRGCHTQERMSRHPTLHREKPINKRSCLFLLLSPTSAAPNPALGDEGDYWQKAREIGRVTGLAQEV